MKTKSLVVSECNRCGWSDTDFIEHAGSCPRCDGVVIHRSIENPHRKTLAAACRSFAVRAQHISDGIYDDAISLADCLDAGTVSIHEAALQIREMESELEGAAAEE